MLMDSYIFSILYKLIYFSLSLNPAIHGMGNSPNICFGCKEQKESQPWFIFCYKLSKIFQAFQKLSRLIIKELIINLKYTFSIPFRITLKNFFSVPRWNTVKILSTLSSEILLLDGVQKKPLSRPGAPF